MANRNVYQEIILTCASHHYPIYIGLDLLSEVTLLRRHLDVGQVLIVTNEVVAPFYLETVQRAFNVSDLHSLILPDGEAHKNQFTLMRIYDALVNQGHHRDTTLIALGGGVIGDITGFAAATYQRGVRFIQLPTTLLAQVDASVGGKTAINHPKAKNMIGSFHQPHAVIIDLNTLGTLPGREFRAGLAEVIKYAILVGGEFLESLRGHLANGLSSNQVQPLSTIIAECCRIKANVVHDDELERGRRVLLNLGHTFAHALEAITHYQRFLHGEAVAIGLYCAALLSYYLGILEKSNVMLVDSLLKSAHLPSRIPKDIDLNGLRRLMFADKKVAKGTLRFVLIREMGDCYLDANVTQERLEQSLQHAYEGDEP